MSKNLVEKISPIRVLEILKLFAILLVIQVVAVMFMPVWFLETARYFFLISIPLSIILAFYIYLKTQRVEFTYDDESFTIKRGKTTLTDGWKKVEKVLIIKTGNMEFLIRLQLTGGTFFDIPASKLKLDPFTFRLNILELVKKCRGSD